MLGMKLNESKLKSQHVYSFVTTFVFGCYYFLKLRRVKAEGILQAKRAIRIRPRRRWNSSDENWEIYKNPNSDQNILQQTSNWSTNTQLEAVTVGTKSKYRCMGATKGLLRWGYVDYIVLFIVFLVCFYLTAYFSQMAGCSSPSPGPHTN